LGGFTAYPACEIPILLPACIKRKILFASNLSKQKEETTSLLIEKEECRSMFEDIEVSFPLFTAKPVEASHIRIPPVRLALIEKRTHLLEGGGGDNVTVRRVEAQNFTLCSPPRGGVPALYCVPKL